MNTNEVLTTVGENHVVKVKVDLNKKIIDNRNLSNLNIKQWFYEIKNFSAKPKYLHGL